MLASVLISSPHLLIADEPVTGLDATVAAAVLDLIADLCRNRGMGMVLVTHDLGVVARMADRVAVVYAGLIVEEGPVHDVFRSPQHPYTEGLLASIPRPGAGRLRPIEGDPPYIADPPPGCPFWPRCPYAEIRCRAEVPPVETIGRTRVRCVRSWGLDLQGVGSR
jgi:oligopeptide transport system ATP-binding protein